MELFNVTRIIDGDTFDVAPQWDWQGKIGTRVRPAGYNTPEVGMPFSVVTTTRLHQLLSGKVVELRNPQTIDRGRLVCDVFLNGRNLANHFPRYRS